MKDSFSPFILSLLLVCILSVSGCSRTDQDSGDQVATPAPEKSLPQCPTPVATEDEILKGEIAFRYQTRMLYNQRKFGDLETIANDLRTSKARFGNSNWKLVQFYDCLECGDDDPESMWQLHDQIHRAWISDYPLSITARVANAAFLVDYAWHARGGGYANTVTAGEWKLFGDRLAEALKVLNDAAALQTKCPVWWHVRMTVALGQGWKRLEFDQLFAGAKAFEPQFWGYDVSKSWYLMPRWYGEPGDWEQAAEADATRPDGLGAEGYAHVVIARSSNYKNVFRETAASWPLARKGCEVLRQKYPDSLEILSGYCNLACQAGDRSLAKQLFQQINGRMVMSVWGTEGTFTNNQNWAYR